MDSRARNFSELMAALASEAPHAVVLDWFRRLELATNDYRLAHGITARDFETFLNADPLAGPSAVSSYRRLRALRNEVAHRPTSLTEEQAVLFAGEALIL